jgi:HSP20 family molecular chaperone IbpA
MPRAKKMKQEETMTDQSASTDAPIQTASAQPSDDHLFDVPGELVADVFETKDHFVVMATIAGVNIKDLDIAIEKGMIEIKGNRPNPHADSDKKYFAQECYFGPFVRRIVLPENVHTDKASAEMDKGMLTIKIPRSLS